MSLLSDVAPRQWVRTPSPALVRLSRDALGRSERSVQRRLAWIWALLVLNVIPYDSRSSVIPLPVSAGKLLTQGALVVAFVLALSVNRRVVVRPNAFLFLMTVLASLALMVSIRGYVSVIGSDYRAVRVILMVAVLWLLTPWWGRRDLLLLRYHRRALIVVLLTVAAGLAVSPSAAFPQAGRLGGAIWPIPPTQVAHYAAVLAGVTVVLWFAGLVRGRSVLTVGLLATAVLLMTHTRTALLAMLLGVGVAALSLFLSRERVRRALGITLAVAVLVVLIFSPFLKTWFNRGEEGQLDQLSGRSSTWSALIAEPRTNFNRFFGFGISNNSFDGLPVDSSWLSTYQDQGLAGDGIDGAIVVVLLGAACASPKGPRRAVALYLATYSLVASFTETGLGAATTYLLDLSVAASVLATPLTAAGAASTGAEPASSLLTSVVTGQ